ncbi:MAG: imidazoleglycerol-phosphate dehydratase HisB [Puniceicoccaceae bacterium]|nr:MAG: imidazoleglycerol-phosphate dehydratase HisB [Puniceicoccaceae bacterium]
MAEPRKATVTRKTAETDIRLSLDLDGSGAGAIDTGIPFFDHLLTLFARHGHFDLEVKAEGDLAVDYHHTVEDVGLVLGDAFAQALGERRGIRRYGFFYLPMDEALARVVVDLGNRPFLAWQVETPALSVRDFHLLLVKEFFRAFSNRLGANLHLKIEYGEEPHHIAEALFKAAGRALEAASRPDPREAGRIPSSKEVL